MISRLRRGRDQDPVSTVKVSLTDGTSSCTNVVLICQDRFSDGIRGDAQADPLDRRATRCLVHCESIEVSSLVHIDEVSKKKFCRSLNATNFGNTSVMTDVTSYV